MSAPPFKILVCIVEYFVFKADGRQNLPRICSLSARHLRKLRSCLFKLFAYN